MSYLFNAFDVILEKNGLVVKEKSLFKKEILSILGSIDKALFDIKNFKQAQFYVLKIDLATGRIEERIKQFQLLESSRDRKEILDLSYEGLETIRYHIEINYALYKDASFPVTRKNLDSQAKYFRNQVRIIKSKLEANKINQSLINILTRSINNAICSDQKITLYRLNYLKNFTTETIEFLETQNTITEDQLLQYLYVANFNSVSILCYICERYNNLKKVVDDERSLLNHLLEKRQELNHLPITEKRPYNSNMHDLKNQVQHWIDEEIVLLKRSMKKKENAINENKKLKFNYSVEVISGFFRLLHDTGITNTGANQTIRWITQHISSKNQPNISQQSIQRKFFEKHSNKEPLKEIVIHLLNHLNHK